LTEISPRHTAITQNLQAIRERNALPYKQGMRPVPEDVITLSPQRINYDQLEDYPSDTSLRRTLNDLQAKEGMLVYKDRGNDWTNSSSLTKHLLNPNDLESWIEQLPEDRESQKFIARNVANCLEARRTNIPENSDTAWVDDRQGFEKWVQSLPQEDQETAVQLSTCLALMRTGNTPYGSGHSEEIIYRAQRMSKFGNNIDGLTLKDFHYAVKNYGVSGYEQNLVDKLLEYSDDPTLRDFERLIDEDPFSDEEPHDRYPRSVYKQIRRVLEDQSPLASTEKKPRAWGWLFHGSLGLLGAVSLGPYISSGLPANINPLSTLFRPGTTLMQREQAALSKSPTKTSLSQLLKGNSLQQAEAAAVRQKGANPGVFSQPLKAALVDSSKRPVSSSPSANTSTQLQRLLSSSSAGENAFTPIPGKVLTQEGIENGAAKAVIAGGAERGGIKIAVTKAATAKTILGEAAQKALVRRGF
jgi:hypothetical protein